MEEISLNGVGRFEAEKAEGAEVPTNLNKTRFCMCLQGLGFRVWGSGFRVPGFGFQGPSF